MEFQFEVEVALVCWVRQDGSIVFCKEVATIILDVTGDRYHRVGAELGNIKSNATDSSVVFCVVEETPSSCWNGCIVTKTNVWGLLFGEGKENVEEIFNSRHVVCCASVRYSSASMGDSVMIGGWIINYITRYYFTITTQVRILFFLF